LAINKERKQELVDEYVELLKQSRAIILAEYKGLSVKQMQDLRAEVRKANGSFLVTKNTLLRLALEQTGTTVPRDLLAGQVGTGFALNEVPALAKTLSQFAKNQEALVIKGGVLGNDVLSVDQVMALANLPSLDELRAQLVGLIQGPARNLAATVAGGVRQLVNVLDAYAKSEDEAEAEATT
jgi:large subunit ribosomal protein L10